MYDTRKLTMSRLRDLAGIDTDDGWMTVGQMRRITGLTCADVYKLVHRLRISWTRVYSCRLYSCADVLARINDGSLSLCPAGEKRAAPRQSSKFRLVSLRLSDSDAATLTALCTRYDLSQSDVIRRLIRAAAKISA